MSIEYVSFFRADSKRIKCNAQICFALVSGVSLGAHAWAMALFQQPERIEIVQRGQENHAKAEQDCDTLPVILLKDKLMRSRIAVLCSFCFVTFALPAL